MIINSTATLATKHKIEACFYSRMRTSQEICQIPNPRQAACCVSSDLTHCSFFWCEEKESAVSHSSTGAAFVLLDAGLRIEGMPALNLWDTVIKVLHPTVNRNSVQIAKPQQRPKTPNPIGSRTCKRSWQASKTYQNLQWKPTRPICRCGDCSWRHR